MKLAVVGVLWLAVFAYIWVRAERNARALRDCLAWDFGFVGWLILGLGGLVGMLLS